MMHVALIGLLATIGGASVSAIVTYFINKYNIDKPKKQSALEEQYIKVLVPIHKKLFFNDDIEEPDNEKCKQKDIKNILKENYHSAPYAIIEKFKKAIEKEDMKEFESLMDTCYKSASYQLGYTQVRIKTNKEILEILASSVILASPVYSAASLIPITKLLRKTK